MSHANANTTPDGVSVSALHITKVLLLPVGFESWVPTSRV